MARSQKRLFSTFNIFPPPMSGQKGTNAFSKIMSAPQKTCDFEYEGSSVQFVGWIEIFKRTLAQKPTVSNRPSEADGAKDV